MDELLEDKSNLPVLQELQAVPTTLTQGGGAGGAAGGGGGGADGGGEGEKVKGSESAPCPWRRRWRCSRSCSR